MKKTEETVLKLKVTEALSRDVGRAFARMGPEDLEKLQVAIGDIVEVTGKRQTVCKAMPAYKDIRGQSRIQLDGLVRENAGAGLDESVQVRKIACRPAQRVVLAPVNVDPGGSRSGVHRQPAGRPALAGRQPHPGHAVRQPVGGFQGREHRAQGPVLINPTTQLVVGKPGQKSEEPRRGSTSYEDIGGLKRQLNRIREMVELPLRYPEVFERLGIDAPKGVLLHGPPGCGKTLIARAVAHETEANFFSVNGPEIIHKFYGESEAHLRKIFEEATRQGPSIIFLDEIDAIAPQREKVVGDVEKRVVAQLLALMDGLAQRQHVIVIAATNLPNIWTRPCGGRAGSTARSPSPSPTATAARRFWRSTAAECRWPRDVDLAHLAAITHGFVGADLEALCREAAMICLRRILPQIDFSLAHIPYELLAKLEVKMDDFQEALREVEPSAIREVFVEVPDVGWDDVGGLDEVKQRLLEAVEWPLEHPESVRAGRHPSAQGDAALRAAGLRQDAAGQGRGHREQGEFHLGERAGAAVEVRGRVGESACARSSARPGRRRRASSSSTRSTPWSRPAAAAAPTRTWPTACSASS